MYNQQAYKQKIQLNLEISTEQSIFVQTIFELKQLKLN